MTEVEQLRARVETLETALQKLNSVSGDKWTNEIVQAALAPSPTAGAVLPEPDANGVCRWDDGSWVAPSMTMQGKFICSSGPAGHIGVGFTEGGGSNYFPTAKAAADFLKAAGYAKDEKEKS